MVQIKKKKRESERQGVGASALKDYEAINVLFLFFFCVYGLMSPYALALREWLMNARAQVFESLIDSCDARIQRITIL